MTARTAPPLLSALRSIAQVAGGAATARLEEVRGRLEPREAGS